MPNHPTSQRPCQQATEPVPHPALDPHRPVSQPVSPLDTADAVFRMLTRGPGPLALNPSTFAPGLPDRQVALDELRVMLLHPATSAQARQAVWVQVVRRARTGGPAWMVGLVGLAMPGLRRVAARLTVEFTGDPVDVVDLHTEILAGFLQAVNDAELDHLAEQRLPASLCWAAFRAGRAYRYREAAYTAGRREFTDAFDGPAQPWGHPDFVLARAVRLNVITAAEADLIGRNRLENVPLKTLAAEAGISHPALGVRRLRAERRLVAAIRAGQLSLNPPSGIRA